MASILWYSDLGTTGLGRSTQQWVKRLVADGHEVTVLATNYYGAPVDRPDCNALCLPAHDPRSSNDFLGRSRLLDILTYGNRYDFVVLHNDSYRFSDTAQDGKTWAELYREQCNKKGSKLVVYSPIDGEVWDEYLIAMDLADISIVQTDWAIGAVGRVNSDLSERLKTVPLGVDFELFTKRETKNNEFRNKIIPRGKEKLGICVNDNCHRKDFPRTLQVIKESIEERSELCFYLHTSLNSKSNLHDLVQLAKNIGLNVGYDVIFRGPNRFSNEEYVKMVQAADLYLSCTTGEGWGMISDEFAACGVPLVQPRWTGLSRWKRGTCYEIFPTIRERPIDDYRECFVHENPVLRPFVSIDIGYKAVMACVGAIEDGETAIPDSAYKWVQQWTWDGSHTKLKEALGV